MEEFEVAIVGAGPAGLSAAIYTARAGMKTLVLGCDPKVAGNYTIDNYFGFPDSITGKDLLMRGRQQAERFGAEITCERVLGVYADEGGTFRIKTEQRETRTCSVILATGVSRVRPGISNIADFEGKGVSYCVSCDGFFYRGKKVIVLGEGIYAANQALELQEYTPDVSICTQEKPIDMSEEYRSLISRAGIPVLERKISRLIGENGVESVEFDNRETSPADGIFIAMGEASSLDFAYSLGLLTKGVFIEADHEQKTNLPGIFAAGDCVGRFLQISVAVGEGAVAGKSAIAHVKHLCRG
ncbi:MAG: NAD(P)/FAD-dependent oxidoreductase [Desulfovibrionales bacterium]